MKKFMLALAITAGLGAGASAWADEDCQAGSAWGYKPGCGGPTIGGVEVPGTVFDNGRVYGPRDPRDPAYRNLPPAERDRLMREQQFREQQLRQQQVREQQAREQQAREQQRRDQLAREQQARDWRQREQDRDLRRSQRDRDGRGWERDRDRQARQWDREQSYQRGDRFDRDGDGVVNNYDRYPQDPSRW